MSEWMCVRAWNILALVFCYIFLFLWERVSARSGVCACVRGIYWHSYFLIFFLFLIVSEWACVRASMGYIGTRIFLYFLFSWVSYWVSEWVSVRACMLLQKQEIEENTSANILHARTLTHSLKHSLTKTKKYKKILVQIYSQYMPI